jgi:hypothetical protein
VSQAHALKQGHKLRDRQAGLGDNAPKRAPGKIARVYGNSHFSNGIGAMDQATMAAGGS